MGSFEKFLRKKQLFQLFIAEIIENLSQIAYESGRFQKRRATRRYFRTIQQRKIR